MELALSLGGDPTKPLSPPTTDTMFREHENGEKPTRDGDCLVPDLPLQLDLLPSSPLRLGDPKLADTGPPWLSPPPEEELSDGVKRAIDVNRLSAEEEEMTAASTENSDLSCFHIEMGIGCREECVAEMDRSGSCKNSDDEDTVLARKKLRLSKEQSAFLEESFKENSTLNPKQKLALARHLNLRPRQVEVWFQNRRARTKLKQTEVDCEYLKRCCEKLTDENRRLHKELQELRALKTSQNFYMHLPATTLTMCPSCERVVATTSSSSAATVSGGSALPPSSSSKMVKSSNCSETIHGKLGLFSLSGFRRGT